MELEKVVKKIDELKVKIEKWEESSKGLNKLLNSQMSAKDKNDHSDEVTHQQSDRKSLSQKTDTIHLETSETVSITNEVNIEKPKSVHESVVSKPKINRDKVIIEDWNSDDKDDVSAVKIVSPVKTNETQTVRNHVDRKLDSEDVAETEEQHTLTEAEQVSKDDLERMIA
ncbi:hypothetical protein Tco_0005666 [Tanacetum coccineum]